MSLHALYSLLFLFGLRLNLVFEKQVFDEKLEDGFEIQLEMLYSDARNQRQKQRYKISFPFLRENVVETVI